LSAHEHTHLPLVSFVLCPGELDLEVLLCVLRSLQLALELLLELLARLVEIIELITSVGKDVGDL
jgi:hypothetical protein